LFLPIPKHNCPDFRERQEISIDSFSKKLERDTVEKQKLVVVRAPSYLFSRIILDVCDSFDWVTSMRYLDWGSKRGVYLKPSEHAL
jgi:hypothetical protein